MAQKAYIRVPITMTDKMINFMESMSLKSKMTGGYKIPNTAIVRACLKALMELDVDPSGLKNEDELKDRILRAKVKPSALAKKRK